jgi:hypothetical protein
MILATGMVADLDQFLETFSTKGAEKRKEYGSRGSQVFRDPDDASRVGVAFDWTRRATRTSWPIPRCRQSSSRPDSRARP